MSKRPANKRKLTELLLHKPKLQDRPYLVWDLKQHGLALAVRPNGGLSFKAIYAHHGRSRWFHLGDARAIGLSNARKLCRDIMYAVAQGKDPQAERKARRSQGTFEELAHRYVEEWSKTRNKSWAQADKLTRKYLIPRWGKMQAGDIRRDDVEGLIKGIQAPILANQVLASASAIFTWALRKQLGGVNLHPCKGIDRNEVSSRARVLSDGEIVLLWGAFQQAGIAGTALKLILLTGQRPGEVCHMRSEHIKDGWWEMPGAAVPALGWPGTKNGESHRIWLSKPVLSVLSSVNSNQHLPGFVLSGRKPINVNALSNLMRKLCQDLNITDRVTPHDLRRTFGTRVTSLGFGRDAMDRVLNHKQSGVAAVYDRYGYAKEDQAIMETVAEHVLALAENRSTDNVIAIRA
jgi:integrase